MKYRNGGYLVFENGRCIHASLGMVSIEVDKEDRPPLVAGGYDKPIYMPDEDEDVESDDYLGKHKYPLSRDERRELAEYMKACWDRWAEEGEGV